MKNLLVSIAVVLIALSSVSCTESRAEQGSKARRSGQRTEAKELTTISTANYYSEEFSIKVTLIETPTQVVRYDSIVTYIPTGKVVHRTLLTQKNTY